MRTILILLITINWALAQDVNSNLILQDGDFHSILQPGQRYYLPVEDSLMKHNIYECDSREIGEYPFYMRFRGTKIEYHTCFMFEGDNTAIYILKYRAYRNEKGEGIKLINRKYLHGIKDFEKLTHEP